MSPNSPKRRHPHSGSIDVKLHTIAIAYRVQGGLEWTEIARIIGLAESTIRSIFNRCHSSAGNLDLNNMLAQLD